jgi:4-alpha-glucanotransferase
LLIYFSFRIDHILGFFRIWEIPTHAVSGLLGRFQPSLPIWRSELEGRGFWDLDRLTKPYIRKHLLERWLGDDVTVIPTYFNERGTGIYELKGEYSTEKQIAAALPVTGANAEKNLKLKSALWSCVQNVVMLQDSEDSNKFYPRIDCVKTTSFVELEGWQQNAVRDLYIEYDKFYYLLLIHKKAIFIADKKDYGLM